MQGGTELMKLNLHIKVKREKLNMSQRDLAVKLGYLNGQYISNMERGMCPVPMDKLDKIIHILKLNPYEVIDIIQEDRLEYLKILLIQKSKYKKKVK